jgi:hypothetical protein
MRRQVGVALAVVVALGLGACGGGGDDDEATQGTPAATTEDSAAEASDGCLLTPEAVSAAVGAEVTGNGPTAGGSSGDLGDGEYSLSWQGCSYDAEGTEVVVAELVDDQGEPDVSGFEQVAAAAGEAGPDLTGLGDEAFVDDAELVVRAPEATVILGFGEGAEPTADDLTTLAALGTEVVAQGTDDVAALCAAVPGLVPDEWQEAGEPVTSTGDGLAAGLDYTYERCTVPLLGGEAELNVSVAGPEVYDARVAAEGPADELPVEVEGIGDGAVSYEGRVYVLVGGRAALAEGESAEGDPLPADALEALGRATADALA